MSVSVDNQFDVLAASPRDESKDASSRSRKDDLKEQAYQAREGVKSKATQIKEQVTSAANNGIELAKGKLAAATGNKDLANKSKEELAADVQDAASAEWETVKKRGGKAAKQAQAEVENAIDENLTPAQKAKLQKGLKQAKTVGKQQLAKANGLFDMMLSAPQLRGVKQFLVRNNLQLPAMIFIGLASLWLGLTLIRMITMATTPAVPEFDLHSKEATTAWLKYHAGEYKGKALDAKESFTGRIANFLANHDYDKMQAQAAEKAVDWKEIGMKKLGLHEPTYTEMAWSWITGRPMTWQERVQASVKLAKTGIKGYASTAGMSSKAAKAAATAALNAAKGAAGLNEPSTLDRVKAYVTGNDATLSERASDKAHNLADSIRANIPGMKAAEPVGIVDSIKNTIVDGVDSIRAHLPGSAEAKAAAAEAQARAYAATHPSTIDNIKNGAEYVKNRVLHGAEEAAHIAHDRAQRAIDEAKYKTGL